MISREEEEEKGKGSDIDGSRNFFLARPLSRKISLFDARQRVQCGDGNESCAMQGERTTTRGKEN